MKQLFLGLKKFAIILFVVISCFFVCYEKNNYAKAVDLPNAFVLRGQFSTDYNKSTAERKHNVSLATKAINGFFLEKNAEFSFNSVVGERTTRRGYKMAKTIFNGKFVDGVGGGVCQVSTTLYNAVLVSGLKITEYHPHSLEVSYCSPSFDAMVNSGSADLKFVNNTGMPIYIVGKANGKEVNFQIYGEKNSQKIERKSVVVGYEDVPQPEIIVDEKGEYPDLYEGETKTISYGKKGVKSEGYLIITLPNGKKKSVKIRKDSYMAIRGIEVVGRAKKPLEEVKNQTL